MAHYATLGHYLEDYHGDPVTAEAVNQFMENLRLPVPNEAQFMMTSDIGAIVFLNRVACTIRFLNNYEHPLIVHPNMLQPLLSKRIGPLRAEIFPGLKVLHTHEDAHDRCNNLRDLLLEDDIDYKDFGSHNTGILPEPYSAHDVVIDLPACQALGAVTARGEGLTTLKTLRSGKLCGSPQAQLFSALQIAFERAWPACAAKPDLDYLKQAWHMAARLHASGILVPGWQHMDDDYADPGRFYDLVSPLKEFGLKS